MHGDPTIVSYINTFRKDVRICNMVKGSLTTIVLLGTLLSVMTNLGCCTTLKLVPTNPREIPPLHMNDIVYETHTTVLCRVHAHTGC